MDFFFIREYQQKLDEANLIDYDDILLFSVKLLENNKDILEYYQEVCEYRVSADYLDFKKCSDFIGVRPKSEQCNECTWREMHAGDFFFDYHNNWYGLKLSDHRYFNFSTNKVYGVNSDFFDIPTFTKTQLVLNGRNF